MAQPACRELRFCWDRSKFGFFCFPSSSPHLPASFCLSSASECTGPQQRQFRVPSLGDITEPCRVMWALSMKLSSLLTLPCLGPIYCSHGPGFLCRYCSLSVVTSVTVRPCSSGFSCLVLGFLSSGGEPVVLSFGHQKAHVHLLLCLVCGASPSRTVGVTGGDTVGDTACLLLTLIHPTCLQVSPYLRLLWLKEDCLSHRRGVASNMLRLRTWALAISIKQICAVPKSWRELGSQPGPRRCENCPRFPQS